MVFDFAAVKDEAQRVVHDTLAVAATYQDDSLQEPLAVRVRFSSRIARYGDIIDTGYSETIEGIDRIHFLVDDANSLYVKAGGTVIIPSQRLTLILNIREPVESPTLQTWRVTRDIG